MYIGLNICITFSVANIRYQALKDAAEITRRLIGKKLERGEHVLTIHIRISEGIAAAKCFSRLHFVV